MGLSSHFPISAQVAPCWCTRIFFFLSLMHPTGPELPISAHVACTRVCRQLYVLRASHALIQATVGVGTVIIVYTGVAYTREGGDVHFQRGFCVLTKVLRTRISEPLLTLDRLLLSYHRFLRFNSSSGLACARAYV